MTRSIAYGRSGVARIRASLGDTLRWAILVGDELVDPDSNSVTYDIEDSLTRDDHASGSLTQIDEGVYEIELDLATFPEPNEYTVQLDYTVGSDALRETFVLELVPRRLFSPNDLRLLSAIDERFSDEELSLALNYAETFINDFTRSSWGGAWHTEVFDGDGSATLLLSHTPIMQDPQLGDTPCVVEIYDDSDGSTTHFTDLAPAGDYGFAVNFRLTRDGRLTYLSTATAGLGSVFPVCEGGGNVKVKYLYGEPWPDQVIANAGKTLARHMLLREESSIPDRARMMTTEWATFQLATADDEHPTGLPEVDSVLRRRRNLPPVTFA